MHVLLYQHPASDRLMVSVRKAESLTNSSTYALHSKNLNR